MKSLLFFGAFPPPFGGIASHLNDIIPLLSKEKYNVLSLTPSSKTETITNDGYSNIYVDLIDFIKKNKIYFFTNLIKGYSLKKDLSWKEYFKAICMTLITENILIKNNVNHLFIYTYQFGYIIPFLKSNNQLKSVKIHLFGFGGPFENPVYFKSIKLFLKSVVDNSDSLLATSDYCSSALNQINDFNNKFSTIYVGVNEESYFPIKEKNKYKSELKILPNTITLLFFGRMNKEMGLDFIIDNYKEILDLDLSVNLLIAGAKSDLSKQVEILSSSNKRINSFENVPFEKKTLLYNSSDILLAPTMDKHACMGVSIKEAMFSGLPVIGSNSGGIPEAIEDKKTGYIVPINENKLNKTIFIEVLENLIKDTNLRLTFGENGRKIALKKFSNTVTLKKYLKLIRNKNE